MDEQLDDFIYVRTASGFVKAGLVQTTDVLKKLTDASGNTGNINTVKVLFDDDNLSREDISRQIFHVGTQGSIWINFLGGDAGQNAPGSVELLPGGDMTIPTRNEVTIVGTVANIPYTAFRG